MGPELPRVVVGVALLINLACADEAPERGAAGSRRHGGHPTACAVALSDSVNPTREGFYREVLFAPPTVRTPRYDDYIPVSYHPDKLDLAVGLLKEAERCGAVLSALLVIGPLDELWTYHILAFLTDGDSLRLNSLVMPHARITGKGTRRVAAVALDSVAAALARSSVVREGLPAFPDTLREPLGREWSYNLLFVRYAGDSARYWHAELWPAMRGDAVVGQALKKLLEPVNGVLAGTRQTYPDTTGSRGR